MLLCPLSHPSVPDTGHTPMPCINIPTSQHTPELASRARATCNLTSRSKSF